MARRKVRKHDLEQYVARQQAPYLKIYDDEIDTRDTKMMRLIDAKDGDFYQPSLNPNPGAQSAWDHIALTGAKTDLQNELIAEARRYYGLDAPRLTNLPPEISGRLEEMFSTPTTTTTAPTTSRSVENPKQYDLPIGPAEKATDLKQAYVQSIAPELSPEIQDELDRLLNPAVGVGLGTGGAALLGLAYIEMEKKKKEEQEQELKNLLSRA